MKYFWFFFNFFHRFFLRGEGENGERGVGSERNNWQVHVENVRLEKKIACIKTTQQQQVLVYKRHIQMDDIWLGGITSNSNGYDCGCRLPLLLPQPLSLQQWLLPASSGAELGRGSPPASGPCRSTPASSPSLSCSSPVSAPSPLSPPPPHLPLPPYPPSLSLLCPSALCDLLLSDSLGHRALSVFGECMSVWERENSISSVVWTTLRGLRDCLPR